MCGLSLEEFREGGKPPVCPKCGSKVLKTLSKIKDRTRRADVARLHGVSTYRCSNCGEVFHYKL